MANNIGVLSIAGRCRDDGHMNLALRYLDIAFVTKVGFEDAYFHCTPCKHIGKDALNDNATGWKQCVK
eukprot:8525560-Ditylum_brightwellii.AAC.1